MTEDARAVEAKLLEAMARLSDSITAMNKNRLVSAQVGSGEHELMRLGGIVCDALDRVRGGRS